MKEYGEYSTTGTPASCNANILYDKALLRTDLACPGVA